MIPPWCQFSPRIWLGIVIIVKLGTAAAAELEPLQLAELAAQNSPSLPQAIRASLPAADLIAGTAWLAKGSDFFFALESASEPKLLVDGIPGPGMAEIKRSDTGEGVTPLGLWFTTAKIGPAGSIHSFHYIVAGKHFGGKSDVPVFGPLSYLQPGVPSGTLSARQTLQSQIYDGMTSNYWVYAPAQYSAGSPAALMIFQDGQRYLQRTGLHPVLNVIDNLIALKKIPVIICVFTAPGDISKSPGTRTYEFVRHYSEKWKRTMEDSMRSTEYDTVSDRYPRFLRDELIPLVATHFSLRADGYSRAVMGSSSGGIAAFNAAWQMPGQFSRVLTVVGSFTSIQWREDAAVPDGGQDYPDKVLRESHRNLRVWLVDGNNDQENDRYGSWPLANVRLANALKLKGYDFRFTFGTGSHSESQSSAQYAEELTWLWRDYDSTKTSQVYELEPAERMRPPFRVQLLERGP